MEVAATKAIWTRSKDSDIHYTMMLSNGDSKAFDVVVGLDVYDGKKLTKEECINHVVKRLTTALTNLRKDTGLRISGKGMLTLTLINTLHTYYQKSIIQNAGDIDNMRRSISATSHQLTTTRDMTTVLPTTGVGTRTLLRHKDIDQTCLRDVGDNSACV